MKLKIGASTLRHFCSNFAGTSSIALDLSDDLKQLILISINLLVVYRELVFYERWSTRLRLVDYLLVENWGS